MPLAINPTAEVVPLRPQDDVRVSARGGAGGIEQLELDLSARDGETHCLVALPAVPNEIPGASAGVRVWMTAAYRDVTQARLPFVLYMASYRDGKPVGEIPLRYLAGPEETSLVLDTMIPAEADSYQLVVYADRRYRGTLRFRNIRLVSGTSEYRIGAGEHHVNEISLKRQWRQEGNRVICASVYGEHWAQMPAGWRLDEVHPAALAAAEWILYAGADRLAFGTSEPQPDPEDGRRRFIGPNTLLAYRLDPDTTAAMALLPDDTIRYYGRRPYRRYFTSTGTPVELPNAQPWEQRLDRLDNLIIIPNTFEQIQLTAGGRHGFAHNFGYAALGLLLADHTDAGVLAFGSVMEQVFLRSGHLFADVVALQRSSYHGLRRLVNSAGMFLALPTAGLSEVLTSRVSDSGRYAGLAISCPRAAADGTPCGTCFKCFRRLRLEGGIDAPPPEESVLRVLAEYPLKSATSVVYAAQRSGYRHPVLDEYRDTDLTFLERYLDYAVEHMLPPELGSHVRRELDMLGIDPMTEDDELRLRTIGQIFWPESFSWSRSGIGEPEVAH
jgi:hypothetical protein